jgi:hypothetical protein
VEHASGHVPRGTAGRNCCFAASAQCGREGACRARSRWNVATSSGLTPGTPHDEPKHREPPLPQGRAVAGELRPAVLLTAIVGERGSRGAPPDAQKGSSHRPRQVCVQPGAPGHVHVEQAAGTAAFERRQSPAGGGVDRHVPRGTSPRSWAALMTSRSDMSGHPRRGESNTLRPADLLHPARRQKGRAGVTRCPRALPSLRAHSGQRHTATQSLSTFKGRFELGWLGRCRQGRKWELTLWTSMSLDGLVVGGDDEDRLSPPDRQPYRKGVEAESAPRPGVQAIGTQGQTGETRDMLALGKCTRSDGGAVGLGRPSARRHGIETTRAGGEALKDVARWPGRWRRRRGPTEPSRPAGPPEGGEAEIGTARWRPKPCAPGLGLVLVAPDRRVCAGDEQSSEGCARANRPDGDRARSRQTGRRRARRSLGEEAVDERRELTSWRDARIDRLRALAEYIAGRARSAKMESRSSRMGGSAVAQSPAPFDPVPRVRLGRAPARARQSQAVAQSGETRDMVANGDAPGPMAAPDWVDRRREGTVLKTTATPAARR